MSNGARTLLRGRMGAKYKTRRTPQSKQGKNNRDILWCSMGQRVARTVLWVKLNLICARLHRLVNLLRSNQKSQPRRS